jgi:transposase InsO family protein
MCRILEVKRSGFYAWQRRPKSKRETENEMLLEKIKEIYEKKKRIYGYPRIAKALPKGMNVSEGRVYRLMKAAGLKSKTARKFKPQTTDSKHNLPVAENILNREFNAEKPCQKWVSDITYVTTGEGFLYLAGILDLYDKGIVGWSMQTHMRKELVIEALHQAIGRCRPSSGLLLHSDRGSQYCSNDYQAIIKNNDFVCSMSRKGNCWDNAPMESFWGKLKSEWLCDMKFKTIEEAKAAIFEYIEIFYNRDRLHSANGYISPSQKRMVA